MSNHDSFLRPPVVVANDSIWCGQHIVCGSCAEGLQPCNGNWGKANCAGSSELRLLVLDSDAESRFFGHLRDERVLYARTDAHEAQKLSLGVKRNTLLANCSGEYVVRCRADSLTSAVCVNIRLGLLRRRQLLRAPVRGDHDPASGGLGRADTLLRFPTVFLLLPSGATDGALLGACAIGALASLASLVLASRAALAVAWWLFLSLATVSGQGRPVAV
mgnify:CR=1 FL=1